MTTRDEETYSLGDAKAHFAECVRRAEKGQSIMLTRHGRPVARLVPIEQPDADRVQEGSEVRERLADYEVRSAAEFSTSETRRAALDRLLEQEIWPRIPPELIGEVPTKQEREEILGLGGEGS